jgi:MazG family protein
VARLAEIMRVLRSPHGCPWDREQSHESLRGHLIEEAYEAVDAIDRGENADLCGELGDVLLQCVFHAQIASEAGRFDLADVANAIAQKLIRRHPHVFTASGRPLSAAVRRQRQTTSGGVREQWQRIKAGEQAAAGVERHLLAGLPRALPALLRAQKIGARAAEVGFDWPDARDVLSKIDEEVAELRAVVADAHGHTDQRAVVDEMGDVLFSIANLARKLGVEPEQALAQANDKFTRRFNAVETQLAAEGIDVHDAGLDVLEAAWTAVKATTTSASATSGPTSRARAARGRRSRR